MVSENKDMTPRKYGLGEVFFTINMREKTARGIWKSLIEHGRKSSHFSSAIILALGIELRSPGLAANSLPTPPPVIWPAQSEALIVESIIFKCARLSQP